MASTRVLLLLFFFKRTEASGSELSLNLLISPLSLQNCLILLDNFENVNVLQTEFRPILLRSPTSKEYDVVSNVYYQPSTKKMLVWFMKNSGKISENATSSNNCTLSKFLVSEPNKDVHSSISYYCIDINSTLFTTKSKPWNCVAHLALYPPLDLKEGLSFPPILHNNPCPFINKFKSGSSISRTLEIMAVDTGIPATPNIWWDRLYHTRAMREAHPLQQFYFIVHIKRTPEHFGVGTLLFQSIQILEISHTFKVTEFPTPQVSLKQIQFGDLFSLNKIQSISDEVTAQVVWHIPDSTQLGVSARIKICGNYLSHYPIKSTNLVNSLDLMNEKVDHGFAHVWTLIMGNFSFQLNNDQCTSDGITKNYKIYQDENAMHVYLHERVFSNLNNSFANPFIIEKAHNSLKFVACGERDRQTIGIHEFASAYDAIVWLLIFICGLTLAGVMTCLNNFNLFLFSFNVTLSVKVLLEQGSPYPASILKAGRIQIVAGIFLFTGVILSNGYKNTNVYKMTTPRKLVLYQKFVELVQDKFEIFSRSSSSVGYFHDLDRPIDFSDLQMLQQQLNVVNNGNVRVTSEVLQVSLNSRIRSRPLDLVLESSRLHPKVKMIYSEVVQQGKLDIRIRGDYTSTTEDVTNFKSRFYRTETDLLLNLLEKCDKTAIVMPQQKCRELARMTTRKTYKPVSVGVESYNNVTTMFTLTGIIPSGVIRRMRRIYESGIWTWWSYIYQGHHTSNIASSQILKKKPGMAGNIRRIFHLLAGGFQAAAVIFILEIVSSFTFSHALLLWLSCS